MFANPEPAPVEYNLRYVQPNFRSTDLLTPLSEPRVTQHSVGLFCQPIPNVDGEFLIQKIPDRILDKMTRKIKAFWVPSPKFTGKITTDMYVRTYIKPPEMDPRYQLHPSIFPRAYNFELDCAEFHRVGKLRAKMEKEEAFKEQTKRTCGCLDDTFATEEINEDGLRWEARPKLFAESQTDPCLRRAEFEKIGQPYRNEACMFYNKHYPQAKYDIVIHKFSKRI